MRQVLNTEKVLLLATLIWGQLQAAPIFNEKYSFIQPDSSFVPVIVNGDEFYQRVEDLNGRTLVRDEEGWICYASLNSDSTELIPGERYTGQSTVSRAGEELHIDLKPEAVEAKAMEQRRQLLGSSNSRSSRLTPIEVTGNRIGLTLLIDFDDQPASVPKHEVEEILNGESGITVKNFFSEISGGKLTYTNEVVGYYRAKKNKSYYDDASNFGRTQELMREALDWLDSSDFDFSSLTVDGKTITAVNFLYAGRASAGWAKGLWPHMGAMWWSGRNSGYAIYNYQISDFNEYDKTIGTFCHENGHMLLKYPDLYPYTGDSEWVGRYCLMSYGGKGDVPVPPNPYFRAESGWLEYEDITDVVNATVQLQANDPVRAVCYRNKADRNQLFVIEAIDTTGKYADFFHTSGMVVWKVNKPGDNTKAELNNPFVAVAGGYSKESTLEDRPGLAFSAATVPAASWISGGYADIELNNLSSSGAVMYFDVGVGGDTIGGDLAAGDLCTLNTIAENGTISVDGSQSMFLKDSDVTVTAVPDRGYEFVSWGGDLTGAQNPASITMNSSKSVTAHFRKIVYDYITMPSGENNEAVIMGDTLFYDDGGESGVYSDGFSGELTLKPGIAGKAVQINFEEFLVEDSLMFADMVYLFDSLEIFNGSVTNESMGVWYGAASPGIVTSTAEDGALTISWIANEMNNAPGWKAGVTLVDRSNDVVHIGHAELMKYEPGLRVVQNQIALSLPAAGDYTVDLFSTNGRLITSLSGTVHSAGVQILPLNRTAAGVFIARLRAGDITLTQRLILK